MLCVRLRTSWIVDTGGAAGSKRRNKITGTCDTRVVVANLCKLLLGYIQVLHRRIIFILIHHDSISYTVTQYTIRVSRKQQKFVFNNVVLLVWLIFFRLVKPSHEKIFWHGWFFHQTWYELILSYMAISGYIYE